ncbi:hypothetical protein [Streptacidiphilus sp. EB103A]|uniref:hypothetical protein n=1 Tax=Streptacidiphilus sp. EB103A TaxID=3156275 RepID=UPI003513B9BC
MSRPSRWIRRCASVAAPALALLTAAAGPAAAANTSGHYNLKVLPLAGTHCVTVQDFSHPATRHFTTSGAAIWLNTHIAVYNYDILDVVGYQSSSCTGAITSARVSYEVLPTTTVNLWLHLPAGG